jgi:glycosyltransferase involved in cell wall biosynthesis
MLHEAFLPFREGTWRQTVAAAVQRLMTIILLASTRRVWVSSPSWKTKVQPYSLGKEIRFTWLPVPSTIPVLATEESVAEMRAVYTPNGEPLIGHFGTHGSLTTNMLDEIIPPVLAENPNCKLLLIGANGDLYRKRLVARYPDLAHRIIATGASDASGVSRSLMVCDLMIQPYPDGVTARRTTCLAGLSHGKAVVTTSGEMTEDFWREMPGPVAFGRNCVETVSVTNRLLYNRSELQSLGERAKAYYRENFALNHLIRMLQLEVSQSN